MKIRILMFAVARDLCDADAVELVLPEAATVGDLRTALSRGFPQIRPILPYCRFAIDEKYVSDKDPIPAEVEIACIPPVSGG